MNALPELKPIQIAVVTRPEFDNTRLVTYRNWIADNIEALSRYYHEQAAALDPEDRLAGTDDDFDVWLLCQYDLEVQRQRPDSDPTLWCTACGARTRARCHCGDIADNE